MPCCNDRIGGSQASGRIIVSFRGHHRQADNRQRLSKPALRKAITWGN
jgi:hypothetical protein